ncbi:hypothetical protein DEU56DRAFT_364827 [Suillus clintonianus]|uniref:uncharacterized protein n=1 Tax=Suillus clintonianus TaxID=1904413 RepID=UPI001B86CC3E|nr:uncharacterized protein DEU56DRAFT_364827 [Suillus clintonianus]KAG2136027.1 hypothetical protein DEU56DRAFT_364827 [Suillus clintonianus]
MPEHSDLVQGIKRTASDVEAAESTAPSNSKRPRVDQSPETSTARRDPKKRKKRRKKEPVVVKLDHHRRDSSTQPQRPPPSSRNEIIRFTSTDLSGSKTRVEAPSDSATVISNPLSHEGDTEKNSQGNLQPDTLKGTDSCETANHSDTKQSADVNSQHPSAVVPEDRISQLTKELAERGERLAAHQSVLSNISQALTCQICLDMMYKPYALAPCGHVACYDCLVQWFNAPPADNRPVVPAILRKKTCPHCRGVVRERPAEIWTIKNLAHLVGKSGLANLPPHDEAQANADRPADADPWDGIFRKSTQGYLPWFLADDADVEPRRGEDVGMLDTEDGGIYRCLDCMHEIWDGLCTSCGRRYPGHEGAGDWSDDELGLDFAPGVEEFDPDDDPGWMGLEEGEGDDEDDGLAIADFYPGLPLFSWRFGYVQQDGEEDEEDDEDEDEDDEGHEEDYESDFIDDENDTGIPRGPIQQLPHIYELSYDDSDNEDYHSPVDADVLSEEEDEDEPLPASRPGRTAPIVVSSDEDEDELDSVFDIRPMPSRPRRGRLVESDDDEVEVLGSSDGSSHS